MTPLMPEFLATSPRPRLFSLAGRLGRIDYLLRGLGAVVIVFALMLLAVTVLPLGGALGRLLYSLSATLLLYVFLPLRFAQLTIRRAHDFGYSGWLALLLLVPLLNLAFWAIPGTRGDNRYGPRPEPASLAARLLTALLLALLLGGFLMEANREPASPPPQPHTTLRPYIP